jgi:histidyl-tRNA synthetase
LDYYTGTIYETLLGDLPEIGSVCSGGRYDNLADLFTAQQLPGVGASLGLDRMLAALEELGRTQKATTPAPVLVTMFDAGRVSDYLQIGRRLRKAGIGTEVYPEAKNIGKQMKYADRKGFRLAVIAGGEYFTPEILAGLPNLRVIARAGVGYDRVDVPESTKRKIAVTITPTANHEGVAEQVFALIFGFAKGVVGK